MGKIFSNSAYSRAHIRRGGICAVLPAFFMVAFSAVSPAAVLNTSSAMVASADSIASAVGADVMQKGGNAVDASVAVAFALAVTYPQAGNIGGGGFMLIRTASGEEKFIDYREKAPLLAARDMYLDKEGSVIEGMSTRGYLASGVPGTVAGMAMAHRLYGSMRWEDLVRPAYILARDGFPIGRRLAAKIRSKRELFELFSGEDSVFLNADLKPGDLFIQKDLAATLKRIMTEGEKDFYRGETAELLIKTMSENGGLIGRKDLESYRAVLREPVRVNYRGHTIVSAPPPSSGGIILSLILQILEAWDMRTLGMHSAGAVHLASEAEKIAYRVRALFMGDDDYYAFPWRALTMPAYAERLRGLINLDKTLPLRKLRGTDLLPAGAGNKGPASAAHGKRPLLKESEETTHFSIVDKHGNAVSNTYTLNSAFGSGVTVKDAGFLLNNEMDDFSIKPGFPNIYGLVGAEANAIKPGKRMLSSMSPTIVLKDGRLFMVLGTPGGSTIPTSVLQVLMNVIDFDMTLEDAVSEPRLHEQYLPDRIFIEEGALDAAEIEALERIGHDVVTREPIGDVQAIQVRAGVVTGVSDPRRSGRPAGY